MTSAVVDALAASLGEQNALLADHPNAFVYNSLGGLLDLEGHFLESEAAHASNQPELPTQQAKLDTLKAEVKFTEACQIYKFSAPQTVSAGVLRVSDMRRGVSVASINLYCNNRTVTDVGELKNKWEVWKRVKTLHLAPAQAEVRFEFTIPIVAANFLVEYATFHEPHGAGGEKLQCPRCSRTVTDKHGICNHCGDNAYQCRHCRNINYEKLDAFLCNECGFCKFARFEFTLTVRPSYVVERVTTEASGAVPGTAIVILVSRRRRRRSSHWRAPDPGLLDLLALSGLLQRLLDRLVRQRWRGDHAADDDQRLEPRRAHGETPHHGADTAPLRAPRGGVYGRDARVAHGHELSSRARRRSSTPHASSSSATCRAPDPPSPQPRAAAAADDDALAGVLAVATSPGTALDGARAQGGR